MKPLPERERFARNIKAGMEVWDDDMDVWVVVESVTKANPPWHSVVLDMVGGAEWSMPASTKLLSRRATT